MKGSNYFSISRRSTQRQELARTPTILAQDWLAQKSSRGESLKNLNPPHNSPSLPTRPPSHSHICNPHPMQSDHEQGRQGINIWIRDQRTTRRIPKMSKQSIPPWDFVSKVRSRRLPTHNKLKQARVIQRRREKLGSTLWRCRGGVIGEGALCPLCLPQRREGASKLGKHNSIWILMNTAGV